MKSRIQEADRRQRSGRPSPGITTGLRSAAARLVSRWRAALPWPVLAAAVAAGVLAAAVARVVFPLLSINNDEAVYLLQADALAHGSLFPRAPQPLSAFIPWLTLARDGHYLPKYTPFFPALLALSKMLTGGTVAALVLVAAAIPVVTYLLAREVTGERRPAVVAALLVAGSPVVVLHTGLYLTYLPTMVLLEAFAWMLLRGVRLRGPGWLAGAGFALSSAAAIRPYDAVLFGLPLVAWALLRRPFGSFGDRVRTCCWIGVGGLLPAALLLAYNVKATGSPLRLPFSVVEPLDKLGFGIRKLFPTDGRHRFGLWQGVLGVAIHLRQMGAWAAGGVVTLALAAVALWRRRPRIQGALLALAATWVTLPLGYLFFWGPWNASVLWTGTRVFGPFYFIPLLPSLAIPAALALTDLKVTRRRAAAGIAGFVVLSSVAMTLFAAWTNFRFSESEERLQALLDVARRGPQLVFVRDSPPFLMHPSAVLANNWEASGQRVFAVHDARTDLEVAERFGGRTLLQLTYWPRATPDPEAPVRATLRQLDQVDGTTLPVALHAHLPKPTYGLLLQVTAVGRSTIFNLGPQAKGALPVIRPVVHGDGTVSLDGMQPMDVTRVKTKPNTITFNLLDVNGDDVRPITSQDLVATIRGGQIRALVPSASLGAFGFTKPPRLQLSND